MGTVFHRPTGPKLHPHFVITHPLKGKVVVVNATSKNPDGSCKLRKTDHPSLTRDCYVSFGNAKVETVADLTSKLNNRRSNYRARTPADARVLRRIRNAARYITKEIPNDVRAVIVDCDRDCPLPADPNNPKMLRPGRARRR